ncbi:MAG: hypothetical protein AB7S26_12475 [Sandaracinaceae bacterium]
MTRAHFAIALPLMLAGCLDTSVVATEIPLSVHGAPHADPIEGPNGALITLSRADVAFGPLYLCSGPTAGELCDRALAEWTDAVVVDGLSADPVTVGPMPALTGTARSYMYDLGIVSLLSADDPLVTDAARSLDGASVVIEGDVSLDGQTLAVTVRVPVRQSDSVERGVPVIRSGTSESFEAAVLPDGRTHLDVRFDPAGWLERADFATLFEDRACAPGDDVVCAGPIAQTCADDGTVISTEDCGASSRACVRGAGCTEHVTLTEDDAIGRALRTAASSGTRPQLTFTQGE